MHVLLRCDFDGLSHVGPRNTRFSGFLLSAIGRGKVTCPLRVFLSPPWSRCTTVFMVPSSWSNGPSPGFSGSLPKTVEEVRLKNCRSCFHQGCTVGMEDQPL